MQAAPQSACDAMQGLTNINLSERYPMADADSTVRAQVRLSPTTQRIHRRALKRYDVLTHYSAGGEPRCACCGESRLEFLAIDHENGGGNKHRAVIGRNIRFHDWLRKNGLPAGYRVLCHNCNLSHGYYGYCPHQEGEKLLAAVQELRANPPRKGSRHFMAALTEDDIRAIRQRCAAGEKQAAVARAYHRCRATINHIMTGRQWSHVK